MDNQNLEYKKSNCGLIPLDWNVYTLKDISYLLGGYAFKSDKMKTEKSKYQVLKMSNLYNNKLDLDRNPSYLDEINKNEEKYKLKVNDIVITLTGTVGKKDFGYSVMIREENQLVLNQRLAKIEAKNDKCINDFIKYILESERFLYQFFQSSKGGTGNQANVSIKDLEEFFVAIPSMVEQQKIVEILSTWDSAIEKQEQLIEKKKEFKKGLMQRLLSGEVRFKNFKDDWKTYKVNNLTKQVINKNKDGNISLVLSVTNKKGFITQEEQFEKQVASKDLSNYKIVRKGEFAYNPSRINVGSIDLLTKFNEGLLSPMYIVFKCDEQLLSEYYNYWIKTNMFKKQMDKYLSGSVRETLSFEDMGLMKIKLPSMEEQKMIVDLLNNMNTEIELLEKELEALKLQKKGLMQRLLTGEVRVKV